jgi:hypothetical protein
MSYPPGRRSIPIGTVARRSFGDRHARGSASLALVAAAAILSHVTVWGGGFIWLDHAHIEDGLALAPLGQALSLFEHGFAGTGYYRPLVSLFFSLDAAIGGGPLLFHATTLAWHAVAAVMVSLAGESLGLSTRAARWGGVLFAVHPATTIVACAIAFTSEAMLVSALMGVIVLHRRGHHWPAALMLCAAALTKETGLVLGPLFVIALAAAAWRTGDSTGSPTREGATRKVWAWVVPEGIALLVAASLRTAFAPAWRATFPALSASQQVGTRLAVLARSLQLIATPFDLSACDTFAARGTLSGSALFGALIAVGLVAGIWRVRSRRLLLGLLALSVLPALQLVPVSRWWSPHYFYFPLALVSLGLASTLEPLGRKALVVAAAGLTCFATASLVEGRHYRDDRDLWTTEVARQPLCREAEFYLGDLSLGEGRWPDAARHYQAALTPTIGVLSYVDTPAALQNLGVAWLRQGRFDLALQAFGAARSLVVDDRTRRELACNMAAASLAGGHPVQAVDLLTPEVLRPDALGQALELQARALHGLGRDVEAAELAARIPTKTSQAIGR